MDNNVKNVVVSFMDRAAVGFKKYGTTTERTDVDLLGWLQHLQEELMDATVYIERLKQEITDGEKKCEKAGSREPNGFEHSEGYQVTRCRHPYNKEGSVRDPEYFVQRHETR